MVYGGRELRDEQLFSELGISQNTLGRYRATLEETGFVHTKTEWFGLKRWYVIGCNKYKGREVTKRQADLAERSLKEIVDTVPEDPTKILNPLFFDLVQKRGGDIQAQIKGEEHLPISEGADTNSGAAASKNGASINDKTNDKSTDEAEEKNMGACGPPSQSTTQEQTGEEALAEEEEMDPDILEIYEKYMKVIGSNSMFPSVQEKLLIIEAIKQEGTVNILGTIAEYDCELEIRKPKWRPVAATEFFKREFYSRFLPRPEPEPKYDDDIMY